MKIFVTGGAGYIGSHVVKALGEAGHSILSYDNLSTGIAESVLCGDLVVGDLADTQKLKGVLESFRPDVIMHFAASIVVEESMRAPLSYFINNTSNTINLLNIAMQCGVGSMVFSSTAAVYGTPDGNPVSESASLRPMSPYGTSKLLDEMILADLARCHDGFNYVALRYFNVAGADLSGRIGQRVKDPSHLILRAMKTAKGEYSSLQIFGDDYPTRDGTCVRDYIHVSDIASAHISAADYLRSGGKSIAMNCGYGRGYTVKEVVETVKSVTGVDFMVQTASRRPGDPPELIADASLIRDTISWTPAHDDLNTIIKTAWEWERRL